MNTLRATSAIRNPCTPRRYGRSRCGVALLAVAALFAAGCSSSPPPPQAADDAPPVNLAEYGLFLGDGRTQEPAEGVIPFDLNTPLFSDYTHKRRFIKLPAGESGRTIPAIYRPEDVFAFPVGTIIAKTFSYPHDMRDASRGERLLETRLLIHKPSGWTALTYVWNDAQTQATLELAGGTIDAQWIHTDGSTRTNNYLVPNVNQCKGCHEHRKELVPIGPKARHLNRDFAYAAGRENQLAHWSRLGALVQAPPPEQAPRLAVWNDPATGSLTERARAWLEVNCAACHSSGGPAHAAGLDLLASQTDPVKFGVHKAPVAAGRGSGGLRFGIVPGRPEESILVYRISRTDAGVMMPELGKRLVDEEGVALIREWIAAMDAAAKP